jgi:2,3-bisphosphoglycerate-independent phosphoglycerate mutase
MSSASLTPAAAERQPAGPVVLLILDGVGEGRGDEFDAVALARTPVLDALRAAGQARTLLAHGPAVGLLSDKDMGNSEVGHNILGAGRVFDQGAKCIQKAFDSGAVWGAEWQGAVTRLREGGTLHLLGLLSDGNVHSHISHLVRLMRRAREDGVTRLRVHALLDGRDVPDHSAEQYVEQLEVELSALREAGLDAAIASGGGRMVTTMDRYEANWSVVEAGWRAHVQGTAAPFASALEAIEAARRDHAGISDQYITPFTVVDGDGRPLGPVRDGDVVIVYNFRGDRAQEICRAFTQGTGFVHFERGEVPDVLLLGMVQYDGDLGIPEHFLVQPDTLEGTISERLVGAGVPQFACAETQKFGHVTYFWNGNRASKFDEALETYMEIPSDRVPFDQRPWMKSAETADALIEALATSRFRFLRANFAGGDMVGHTGSLDAAVVALEAIDLAVGRVWQAVRRARGCLLVTADHGNADEMVERDADGSPLQREGAPRWKTSHSLNPVRFVVWEDGARRFRLRDGLNAAGLANVAPTVLELLGFEAPADYEPSLIEWM